MKQLNQPSRRNHLADFTNLFPLSKTLRFSLIPIGKTEEFITRSQYIEEDEERAKAYVKAKEIIDRYHKLFIDDVLLRFTLKLESNGKLDSLEEFFDCYYSNDEQRSDKLAKISDNLRKSIARAFSCDKRYSSLFKADLFKKLLPSLNLNEQERRIVKQFQEFTTYFVGFHQNRKNMYVADGKSTSIAHRIIDVNLIKYVENLSILTSKIAPSLPDENIAQLMSDFSGELNGQSLIEFFSLAEFSHHLRQSEISVYNSIVGGIVGEDGKTHLKGLNQYINLFNQTHPKSERLPLLKPLFKQILSDRESISFIPEQFNHAKEVAQAITNAYEALSPIFPKIDSLLRNLVNYNLDGIYIANDPNLALLSQRHFGSYDAILKAIKEGYKLAHPMRKGASYERYDELISKGIKQIKSLSLAHINRLMGSSSHVESYFQSIGAIDNEIKQQENLISLITCRFSDVQELLGSDIDEEKLRKGIKVIKNFLDAIMLLKWFVKPLLGTGDEVGRDMVFYGEFTPLYEDLDNIITPLYTKVRSYLTRKPYSTEKFKLNFSNPTLLNGWDYNKEPQYSSIILLKEGQYFLGIINPKTRKETILTLRQEHHDGVYHKMFYKQINAFQDIPHKAFAQKNRSVFNPSKKVLSIKQDESFKTGDSFNKSSLHELIDYYKHVISHVEDWNVFGFNFSDTNNYESISDFYNEVNDKGYLVQFSNIPEDTINHLINNGMLFLFRIHNKDFSNHSKGRPNLHTIYWKMLFDERNLSSIVYKLNGGAEIFFRRKTKGEFVTHKAHTPIDNKSDCNKEYKATSTFDYDIIKDRRYTIDHYEFHVPITMNYKSAGDIDLNRAVRQFMHDKGVRHIIGIDRGERHLLYLTMIDLEGNIVKQFSLNQIASNPNVPDFKQDYHSILNRREGDLLQARQNWATIEGIKELKSGYLSQVVHILAKLMVENDAIIVLENLNKGFMRGRLKVEKSVYQKFEKALIDKLNYLVDKGKSPEDIGGALHAIQLSTPYERFCKTQKGNVRQSGFVFYIPAWNTSNIDPTTGFVNMFDLRLTSIEAIKSFFSKMESIKYDSVKDCFMFTFDYNNFTSRAQGSRARWTLTTRGTRIYTHRDPNNNHNFVSEEVDVTLQLKALLQDNQIALNANLKEMLSQCTSKAFLEKFLHLFKLTMQMRNSETGKEIDYIISPALDVNGRQFDSRLGDKSLPENADANGAFNIARKGLMLIEQAQAADNIKDLKFDITNRSWLQFAQR